VDDEELEEGLRCIAVPLLDAQRLPVAAVSISGPFSGDRAEAAAIANQFAAMRAGIAADMGYTPARATRELAGVGSARGPCGRGASGEEHWGILGR